MIFHSYVSLPEGIQTTSQIWCPNSSSPVTCRLRWSPPGLGTLFGRSSFASTGQEDVWKMCCGWFFGGGWGPGDWKFSKSHLDQWSMIYFPVVGGFQHVLFSIIYGNNPSHWLSYFSRWLKTTNQLFSIFLFFFCGFYPFLQSVALKVIIAWTKFLVMSCETWLGNPGSMAGEWNGHCSMGNERYERQTMFDYHEAKPQKDTKKNGVETSGAR